MTLLPYRNAFGAAAIPDSEATPLEAEDRLSRVKDSRQPWMRTKRQVAILSNLRGFDRDMRVAVPRPGQPAVRRQIAPWPPTAAMLSKQPVLSAGTLVAPVLAGEADCYELDMQRGWGLTETCILSSGLEVIRDFPFLRDQGYVAVGAIDNNGHFVMGWLHRSDLRTEAAAAPTPVPMPTKPPPRTPRPIPWQTPPAADVVVAATRPPVPWKPLAVIGGVAALGLVVASAFAKKQAPKTTNRGKRKVKGGWHWVDRRTAVHVRKGRVDEVQTFTSDLDAAVRKAERFCGCELRVLDQHVSRRRGEPSSIKVAS